MLKKGGRKREKGKKRRKENGCLAEQITFTCKVTINLIIDLFTSLFIIRDAF